MTLILAALLIGISFGTFTWLAINRHDSKRAYSARLDRVVQTAVGNSAPPPTSGEPTKDYTSTVSLNESFKTSLDRSLYLAGLRKTKHQKIVKAAKISALAVPGFMILFGAVTGNLSGNVFSYAIFLGVAIRVGTLFFIKGLVKKRRQKIMKSMPTFFDLLVIALEAGVNFTAALPRVIKEMPKDDELSNEFDIMHNEYLAGLPFKEACRRLSQRCDVEELAVIMDALIESEELGASLSGTLRIQSDELRHKIKMRVKEQAHKIPVKLLLPMLLIFTTIFVVVFGPLGNKLFKVLREDFPDTGSSQFEPSKEHEKIEKKREMDKKGLNR